MCSLGHRPVRVPDDPLVVHPQVVYLAQRRPAVPEREPARRGVGELLHD